MYANKKCEEMMGYKREEFYSPDFDLFTLIAPESQDLLKSSYRRHMKGEEVAPFEYTLLTREGKRIEAIITTKLIKYEGENAILGIITDITEREQAEEVLRKSEENYRSIVELAPDGIITVDRKGMITSVNNAFSSLTGYSQDEIVGVHFTKLRTLRARDMPEYIKLMSSIMRGKIPQPFEYSYIRKNRTIGWGEAHVGLLKRDGKTTGFQVLLRDTTGRKMAEKATQESEEKSERLFTNNPEAAVYVDSRFHVLDVNPRFEELFGYSLDDVRGEHIDDIVVPKDKTKEAAILDKKATKGPIYQDTVRKKKDGTLVSVSISAAPITLEGKPVGYVAMYKDISQLKRTEKQLQETLEKLSVVGELTRHDARNKLSSATMNTFLAKQKLPDDHEALQHLREVESAVRQTERIFDFARIYEKLGMEELVYVDAEKSLNKAVRLLSDIQGIEVVNDCHGLTVLADSLLRQLFYNLIDNSLKHGEKVSQVRVHYENEKDSLKLVYEDDGVGIPKAEKPKIFEEGYGQGTGHGLYLIRKMCEVYGWTIKETGKHGKGAQFSITMPKMGEEEKTLYKLR